MQYQVRTTAQFEAWHRTLDQSIANRVARSIDRMRDGNLGHYSPIRGFPGVHERRETYGGGVRIYFAWDGPALIILLGGGDKSSQRRDIERAYQVWQSYQ